MKSLSKGYGGVAPSSKIGCFPHNAYRIIVTPHILIVNVGTAANVTTFRCKRAFLYLYHRSLSAVNLISDGAEKRR